MGKYEIVITAALEIIYLDESAAYLIYGFVADAMQLAVSGDIGTAVDILRRGLLVIWTALPNLKSAEIAKAAWLQSDISEVLNTRRI